MLEDLVKERKKKLRKYEETGNPYPAKVHRDATLAEIIERFSAFESSKKSIAVAGRIMAWRDQGKIIFAHIQDGTGKFQLVFNEEKVKNFKLIKETFDIGDFVEAQGKVFNTERGEKSLLVQQVRMIAKSLKPLPAHRYGLEDVETKLRERYLDILLHPEIKEMFVKKSLFWDTVREHLKSADFLEVEMPVFERVPGGADAEPFITHLNALDMDLYLRISLELPLKKLLVGGYEKVFEIGRIFRNEGIDREHLQDYTQMECYWAYADYEDMMELTEKLYKDVVKKVCGTLIVNSCGHQVDWGKKWRRLDYYEIFKKETGVDLEKATIEDLQKKAKELKLEYERTAGKGRIIDIIFKKAVIRKLIQPCFLVNPPVEIEPLAKRLEKDSGRVARFQIMAVETELGKGFSELNDPIDQRERFEEQMKLREKGDKEAQRLDEEFLEALEYGMPPAAGFGMSERVFAILMDKPIRETVFFPLMKRKSK
ncbi:MAG: lysine--tRNA ligase [Patescibacteria group bacterium]|nr:lysine--tRNA ligase [Patescibacteria group bacterium]